MSRSGKQYLDELQGGINRLFEQVWHGGVTTGPFDGQDWAPALELRESHDRYDVAIEVPGVEMADIEVIAYATQVVITGQKPQLPSEPGQSTPVSERRYGSFKRVIPLPEAIQTENVGAMLKLGVLHVTTLKKDVAASPSVRIEVKEAE